MDLEASQLSLIQEIESDQASVREDLVDERKDLKERTKQESRRVKQWRRNVFSVVSLVVAHQLETTNEKGALNLAFLPDLLD